MLRAAIGLNQGERLDTYGVSNLDVDRGEPVVTVWLETIDDGEELLVQGRGDGAHGAVADEDAVDRAEVGDLSGGAGEEGFIADVEHLTGQRLLDDLDAELPGQREDGAAGDAVEDGVGQGSGVEDAAADEEEIFAGSLREVAVDVERDTFGVTVDLGLHADELRIHIVGASLGERGHGVGSETRPTGDTDVCTLVAGDVFAPGEVGDVDLDGRLEGIDTDLPVAAEGHRPDVARGDAVGLDNVDDGGVELLGGVRQGHAINFGGVGKAGHVLLEAEYAGAVGLGVTADTLEDGGPIVDDMGHDVDIGLIPRDELSVVPDVCGGL